MSDLSSQLHHRHGEARVLQTKHLLLNRQRLTIRSLGISPIIDVVVSITQSRQLEIARLVARSERLSTRATSNQALSLRPHRCDWRSLPTKGCDRGFNHGNGGPHAVSSEDPATEHNS